MLFSAEQNRALLLSLLNAVLIPERPIVAAELLHAQPERADADAKSIALDLRVRLKTGEQIDVEMQTQPRPAQRQRALYYWSRLYGGQLPRGADYSKLRRCVVVLITKYQELDTSRFHSIFEARERHDSQLLTDQLELHLVELPKLQDAARRNDEPSLVRWGKFLAATADEDLEALAMQDPILSQAKDALDRLSADPDARIRAEMRELALISYELDIGAARDEGEARGRAEGEARGRAEGEARGRAEGETSGRAQMMLHLLALKFGELSDDSRQRVGRATADDLQTWSQRLLSAKSIEAVFSGATTT